MEHALVHGSIHRTRVGQDRTRQDRTGQDRKGVSHLHQCLVLRADNHKLCQLRIWFIRVEGFRVSRVIRTGVY